MTASAQSLDFVKMEGLGNDFVLLDQRTNARALAPETIVALADRRYGVGCDQVLVLEPPTLPQAAARYRIFNADGGEAEHCGNGVRCVARYLVSRGVEPRGLAVEIGGALCRLELAADGAVTVDMGIPAFEPAAIPLALPARDARYRATVGTDVLEFGAVSMGNPHAVIAVDDVAAAPVATLGPAVQASPLFPAGVNVGFLEVLDPTSARLRVYERGAGETRACGTGACAAVAVGRSWGLFDDTVIVHLAGGDLVISWSGEAGARLWMTGPATEVFVGRIEL